MTINSSVVQFAVDNMGSRVGAGECFDLADRALRHAGARSAADYGEITPNADYEWGTAVELNQVTAGDIIQFRNYQSEITVEIRYPDGSSETSVETQSRPHHTAIVSSIGRNGRLRIYEQNVGQGTSARTVQHNFLNFSTFSEQTNESRDGQRVVVYTSVTVRGQIWFYHPVSRSQP